MGELLVGPPPAHALPVEEHSIGNPADGLRLAIRDSGRPGPLYFVPHDNENIAVRAVERPWRTERPVGVLVEVRQIGNRYIYQRFAGRRFYADPNRLYDGRAVVKAQIEALPPVWACGTVLNQRLGDGELADAAARFERIGKQILRELSHWLRRGYGPLVAVHNNTEGEFAVDNAEGTAGRIHRAAGVDTDDFFLVTHGHDFEALGRLGYNVALQPPHPTADGSLSVWAARHRLRYINVEAQHRDCLDYTRSEGHLDYQFQMLRALYSLR